MNQIDETKSKIEEILAEAASILREIEDTSPLERMERIQLADLLTTTVAAATAVRRQVTFIKQRQS